MFSVHFFRHWLINWLGFNAVFKNKRAMMALESLTWSFFLHFSYKSPAPGSHSFRPIKLAWRNLIEGHPRNISTNLFENQPDTFGGEDFLSFHYSHIMQNSPAHWRRCFFTNQHGLKESESGLSREHFYKIIWKPAAWHFRRRRF